MRRAQIDTDGNLHCWRCGSTAFVQKRSLVGKVGFGLLAPKHTKCMACGTFSKRGKPTPYTRATGQPAPTPQPQGPPAGWYPDPGGQPVQRWWDGTTWTEHTQAGMPQP